MPLPAILAIAAVGIVVLLVVVRLAREASKNRAIRKKYGIPKFPKGRKVRWVSVVAALFLLGAAGSLAFALAQFRVNKEVTHGSVMLVIDTSKSMDADDVSPTRLAAAQDAAKKFLQQVPGGFQVGLVTFAATPELRSPPLLDRGRVERALGTLPTSQGTAIGDGLTSAIDAIVSGWPEGEPEPAAVLLLSDGADTGSTVLPMDAAERAHSLGIKTFTVVLRTPESGTEDPGILLRQIATTTEAQSFSAGTASELTQIYATLGSTLSTRLAVGNLGPLFVGIAAGLAFAAAITVLIGIRSES